MRILINVIRKSLLFQTAADASVTIFKTSGRQPKGRVYYFFLTGSPLKAKNKIM